MVIPMSSPDLTATEIAAVCQVLETPQLSMGSRLKEFEQAVATYANAAYGIGVNSGTSGLHLCMIAAGIKPGDLVITTPFSFIASANCVVYEQGVPVFVDVDPHTGNIAPDSVAEVAHDLVTTGTSRWLPPALRNSKVSGRIKSILPIHAFGQPADMDPLLETAAEYGLTLIEDACEAIGAHYKGRPVGALGDAGVFAFYPNKQITTGEGGMIVTDRTVWADLFRSLRNQGRDVFDAWLNHTRLGYNYRLDEMSAALGAAQMQRLNELLDNRARVASWYQEHLADIALVEPPTLAQTTSQMSWFVYVVRIRSPARRDDVLRKLAKMDIPSRPYFMPIHLQPFYIKRFGYRPGDYSEAERLGDVSLALPFSSIMTEEQVGQVCSALQQAVLG